MLMKQAVIFDMDGVLVNSEQLYFERRMNYFTERGLTPDSSDIRDFIGMSNAQVWAALVNDPVRRVKLHKEYLSYQDANPVNYASALNVGVKELLQFLQEHNIRVILASAGIYEDIHRMLDECNIRPYFDYVLSGERVAHNKPAPDIYLEAVRLAGVPPTEALVIEDSTNGITAAKRAGLETWAIDQSLFSVDQTDADRIVSDMNEVKKLIAIDHAQ